jgi:hypothetical protein
MAGENSPEARARADAYAKQQSVQLRMQKLNESKGAAITKVGTKNQVVKKGAKVIKPLKSTTTTTNVTATEAYDFDPEAYINKSFNTKGGKGIQNPPFIYPGRFDRTISPTSLEVNRRIDRGYIRRLTEFYDKQTAGANGTMSLDKSTVSTVDNMKCNFQFNPDNLTRMVTAESDMTFFFNQDPAQLAQPVPGKAGFSFELLFNREAEVASKSYLTKDNKKVLVDTITDFDPIGAASTWIGKPHNPEWVTKIGVLADILILDDVIGQGLAKDILDKITKGEVSPGGSTWGFDTTSPGSPTTSTTSGSTTTKAIDQNRYDAYSMNMGNKAYLTPTPVRIMFTKWMMVEGFVQSVQVTFNKFSRQMIPTQASVMIQMQALYMGFAQQKTFLTDLPGIELGTVVPPSTTTPAPGTNDEKVYKYIDELLAKKSFFDKNNTINAAQTKLTVDPAVAFIDLFRLNDVEVDFCIDKKTGIVKYGAEVIEKLNKDKVNYEVRWDGVLKVYWDSHAVASNGSELTTRNRLPQNAPSGYKYKAGPPPNSSGPDVTDYKLWGTATEPMVFTSTGNQAFPKVQTFFSDLIELGDTDFPTIPGEIGSRGNLTTWTLKMRSSKTDEQKRVQQSLLIPYKEDKFTFDLGIRWYIHEITEDVDIYMYDWHHHKETDEIQKFRSIRNGTDKSEWFRAPLEAMNYRNTTSGPNSQLTGAGVSWFNEVQKYLGGAL